MLIVVINPKEDNWQSSCAVNLACELAGHDPASSDRWDGKYSVVLSNADAGNTTKRFCSGGRLPVSCERPPLADSKDIERWIRQLEAITVGVDYVVVDNPSRIEGARKTVIDISDLVVVLCSDDLAAIVPVLELIRTARAARSNGGPKCLLVPTLEGTGDNAGEEIESVLRKLGEPLGPALQQSSEFTSAFETGRWIGDHAPNSGAHRQIKALAASVERTLSDTNAGPAPSDPRSANISR